MEIYKLIAKELIKNISQKATADLAKRVSIWRNNDPLYQIMADPITLLLLNSIEPYQGLLYSFFRDYFLDSSEVNLDIMSLENIHSTTPSLESKFQELALNDKIDIWDTHYKDYLYPNETSPHHVASHLSKMADGYLVSTGTERTLFNLLYAPEDRCKGIICLDINPRVKAYNDFNVMLIRLCPNANEYARLSSNIETEDEFNARLCEISALLRASSIPHHAKFHYHQNLKPMGVIFFREQRFWRSQKTRHHFYPFKSNTYNSANFNAVNYSLNEGQYLKLKRYADSGNIVTITQDIFNLPSLGIENIGAIDISNIPDFFYVAFNGLNPNALIIYYDFLQINRKERYQSYFHRDQEINESEKIALKREIEKYRNIDLSNNIFINGNQLRKSLREKATNQLKVDCSKLKLGLFLTKDNYEFFNNFLQK